MLPEEGADEMEIGGEMYEFNFPVNGIALSPDKTQLHYSAIGRSLIIPCSFKSVLLFHIFDVTFLNICFQFFFDLAGYDLYQLPTEIAQQPDVVNISSFVRRVGDKISQGDGMVMGVNNLYYGALAGVFDSSAVYWPYQLVNIRQIIQDVWNAFLAS